jgi:3-oxoacyl-[acyl-carrier protein] reductase
MDLQLGGKRAIVTGSNTGFGEAIARKLAGEGASVAVHGRNEDRCRSVAGSIKAVGGEAVVAVGDLATNDGANAVAQAAVAQLGGIDILVNNAGGYEGNEVPGWFDLTPEKWAETFQMNTLSAVRMALALVPAMKERGWGRVVNISTGGAMEPVPQQADYCAAKAAVANMTMSLSRALADSGVTVNTVRLGVMRTTRFETWVSGIGQAMDWEGDLPTVEARFLKEFFPNTVGHAGSVDDIGNAVTFLASPNSGFITGANLRVDGGQLRGLN